MKRIIKLVTFLWILIKRLFFLNSSVIVSFINKVYSPLCGKRFAISMDLLLDEATRPEIKSSDSCNRLTSSRWALAHCSRSVLDVLDAAEWQRIARPRRPAAFGRWTRPSSALALDYAWNWTPLWPSPLEWCSAISQQVSNRTPKAALNQKTFDSGDRRPWRHRRGGRPNGY